MVDCIVIKNGAGYLQPADEASQEYLKKMKVGDPCSVKLVRQRNLKFFRKWWALVGIAYDWWEPGLAYPDRTLRKFPNLTPEKNLDRFRKDITILAGFYEQHFRLNGDLRIEAKSLKFDKMDEDEFDKLYDATIQVVLNHIASQDYTEDELRALVDETLSFA